MGQDGIPYVMIMPFDYSYGGEAFLNSFKDNMLSHYPDLQVTEDIHEIQIGQYDCWQTRYEHTISSYQAQDRRVAIDHNGKIYMFAVKEIPELNLSVGTLLKDTIEGLIFFGSGRYVFTGKYEQRRYPESGWKQWIRCE